MPIGLALVVLAAACGARPPAPGPVPTGSAGAPEATREAIVWTANGASWVAEAPGAISHEGCTETALVGPYLVVERRTVVHYCGAAHPRTSSEFLVWDVAAGGRVEPFPGDEDARRSLREAFGPGGSDPARHPEVSSGNT
jgi:hypothetical protein